MKYLVDSAISQPLLAFAFAYYVFNVIGSEIRRNNPALTGALELLNEEDSRTVKKSRLCRLLSLGFVTITICFALFPEVYAALAPIKAMRYPVYNLFGVILLGAGFLRMLLVHVDMDRDMYLHNQYDRQMSAPAIMDYTNRMLGGYYTLFVGFTFILSNWACVALLAMAAFSYREK